MSSNYHTPIPEGAAANAKTFNDPLGQMDEALSEALLEQRDGHIIQKEGLDLPQKPRLDFAGAGVMVTDELGKTLVTIPGATGGVQSVVAGGNVAVDNTDPENPVVSASGVQSVVAGSGITVDDTDPENPIIAATGGGGNGDKYPMEFRLTLESGVPVSTSDQTGKTTIYCTPYKGNQIALYDGVSAWITLISAEFSLALGTLTSGLPYDVFCYNNGGTPTLEFLAWTNGTTRATALTKQDGVLVKAGATTRRYLGTFYTTATTTTEDSFGNRYLFNYYNRVRRPMRRTETTGSWGYTNGTYTPRPWNNSTSNRVNFIIGVSEDPVYLWFSGMHYVEGTGGTAGVGIGLDSTTTQSEDLTHSSNSNSTTLTQASAVYNNYPGVGVHYLQLLEIANPGFTTNFYGLSGTIIKNGATGYVMA